MNLRPKDLHRRVFRAGAIAVGICWLAVGVQPAVDARDAKTVRLLSVGNSFSRNATHYVGDLAKAAGDVLIHHQATVGGAPLALHCEKFAQFERDPNDKRGLYSTGLSLRQELETEPWDFVTIQQASIQSCHLETYRPYARQLYDYIHRHAPKAEVLLHETWAYRVDDPLFPLSAKAKKEPSSQEAMYRGLASAYDTIAGELGVRVIPVGDAFHLADTDSAWGYQPAKGFDFTKARPSELPDQAHSLHVGWRWVQLKGGEIKLTMDGHHANMAGEYLGGCVFYEVLFGESVVDNTFVPQGLDPADARYLRRIAHRAVVNRRSQ
jgi:uncharacterized protein DUF4886